MGAGKRGSQASPPPPKIKKSKVKKGRKMPKIESIFKDYSSILNTLLLPVKFVFKYLAISF
jgi:hypothetical protein